MADEQLYPDYWLVWTPWGSHTVSSVMAATIRPALTQWPRPRWVSIVDIAGARVMLRTATIVALEQSSPESRAMRARFREERKEEDPERYFGW